MTPLRLDPAAPPTRTLGRGIRVLGALGASALLVGLLAGCTGDAQTPVQSGVVEPTSADDGSTRTPTNEPSQSVPSETATPAT